MGHPVHRMVLDLSHHNTVQSFEQIAAAGIVGMIHKATEGVGYTDPKYEARRAGCREAGILFGAYHFATASDAIDQAEHFLQTARLTGADLFCLDWEDYGANTLSKEQARAWIEHVEGELGRPGECVIYSGNTAKEKLGANDTFFGARRLWLAQYGSNPAAKPPWSTWWLWQYSDGSAGPGPHGCPGVTGHVDTNSYDGPADQLLAEWASGEVQPEPEPGEVVVTLTIEAPAGVRVIVNRERT